MGTNWIATTQVLMTSIILVIVGSTKASMMDDFKHNATLLDESSIPVHAVENNSFFLEGCDSMVSYADENLNPATYDEHASVFKIIHHDCGASVEILVSKMDGCLLRAVKTNKSSNERIYLTCFYDDDNDSNHRVCTTYTEQDIDEKQLEQFQYGESMRVHPGRFKYDGLGVHGDRRLRDNTMDILPSTNDSTDIVHVLSPPERRGLSLDQCSTKTVIRLALRYDSGYCATHNDDAGIAEAYLNFIVADMNEWFGVLGLCFEVEICSIMGYCNGDGGQDPLRRIVKDSEKVCGRGPQGETLIDRFRRRIGQDDSADLAQCDAVHLVYGSLQNGLPPFETLIVGCAYAGAACTPYGVGVNYFGFTKNEHLHTVLLAHELGHTLNATHTHRNDLQYVMRPVVCEQCDMFSDQSIEAMSSFTELVHSLSGGTCTAMRDANPITTTAPVTNPPTTPQTTPPTTPPTSDPTAILTFHPSTDGSRLATGVPTAEDECSNFTVRSKCNKSSSRSCTWIKFLGVCQRRADTECYQYPWMRSCQNHGSIKNCAWNKSQRLCESTPDMTPSAIECSYLRRHACNFRHECAWIGHCEHRVAVPCSDPRIRRRECRILDGCAWDRRSRTCTDESK